MMRFMAADTRLLPSVQRTVGRLEPLLQQLVVQDTRFSRTAITLRASCSTS